MYIHPEIFKKIADKLGIELEKNDSCLIANFGDFEIFVPHVTWGNQKYQEEGNVQIYFDAEDLEDNRIDELMPEEAMEFFEELVVAKMKARWEEIKKNSRQ